MAPHWNNENSGAAKLPIRCLAAGNMAVAMAMIKVANNNNCQYKPKYLADQAKLASTHCDRVLRSNRAKRQKQMMNPALSKNRGASTPRRLSLVLVKLIVLPQLRV